MERELIMERMETFQMSDIEDVQKIAKFIKNLPRDQRLIIYGSIMAHAEMAEIGYMPYPSKTE